MEDLIKYFIVLSNEIFFINIGTVTLSWIFAIEKLRK
jgi:hypothetical protein